MPGNNQSVFMPVPPPTPENVQGPFSQFLNPARRADIDPTPGPPPAHAGKGTSLAYVAMEFLKGIKSGRLRGMEEQENERLKGLQALHSQAQQVWADPNASEEDKKLAMNEYSRALGATGLSQMGGAGKGKGKKSPDEYPSKDGQVVGGSSSPLGVDPQKHLTNIMKDVFTGMAGGKAPPKGDVNFTESIGRITASMNERKAQYDQLAAKATETLQQMTGKNQTEVQHAMMPIFQQMSKLRPKDAADFQAQAMAGFSPAPEVARTPARGSMEEGVAQERAQLAAAARGQIESFNSTWSPALPPDFMAPPGPRETMFYGQRAIPPKTWTLQNNTNPTDTATVTQDFSRGGGYFYSDGRPVPEEMLSGGAYSLHTPGTAARTQERRMGEVSINGTNFVKFQKPDGTFYYETSAVHPRAPNHYLEMFSMREAAGDKKAEEKRKESYLKERRSVNKHWDDTLINGPIRDPFMKGESLEAFKKTVEENRKKQLAELDDGYLASTPAKKEATGKPPNKKTPALPPTAPTTDRDVDAWAATSR